VLTDRLDVPPYPRNPVAQRDICFFRSLRPEATEAAATTTKAVSRGALIGPLSLLLGAVAAWFVGRIGAVDPTGTGFVPTDRALRQT
jgi:hypothetical protein